MYSNFTAVERFLAQIKIFELLTVIAKLKNKRKKSKTIEITIFLLQSKNKKR